MIALRTAQADDLDAIMRLEREAFAETAWSEEAMRQELAGAWGRYIVAVHEQELVGYAGLRAVGEDGDIQTICVTPSRQGQGIGRAMLGELVAEAQLRGVRQIFLEVRDDNVGARHLYESLGWDAIDVRVGYYQPGNIDAIVMRRVL